MGGSIQNLPSISDLLRSCRPDSDVVAWGCGDVYDWGNFKGDVSRVCAALCYAKQRCALYTENSYWFAVGLVAALQSGCRLLLLPNAQQETLSLLEQGDFVLSDSGSLQVKNESLNLMSCGNSELGCNNFASTLNPAESIIEIFTSGSTGQPKRIKKTLANFEIEINSLEALWGDVLDERRVIASVSHQHVYGVLFRIMWPLYSGRPFASNLIEYPEQLEAYDPDATALVSSPALLKRVKHESKQVLPSLVFSSGGPLNESTNNQLCTHFNAQVWEVFGSTETGGVAIRSLSKSDLWQFMPGVTGKLSDEGQLVIDSPHVAVGCEEMGDKIDLISENQFRILGRADRVVKLEEKRVSLVAVEQHLKRYDGIQGAYAFVLPGRRDLLAVLVELDSNGETQLAQYGQIAFKKAIKVWLARLLEPVTMPRKLRFVSDIPVTAQGKVDKGEIEKLFAERSGGAILPQVKSCSRVDTNKCSLNIYVPVDCVWFDGHFDGAPILSGVAQIDWVMALSERYLKVKGQFSAVEVLKFQNIIRPCDEIGVALEYLEEKNKLIFRMTGNNSKPLSSGRIVLTNEDESI